MISDLLELGLSLQEAKVYIALLKLGESQTGRLSKESQISPSHIYSVLEQLLAKGFVNYKMKNNIKIFMASSPDTFKDLFEKKKQELLNQEQKMHKVIADLKSINKTSKITEEYKYFEGIKGVKAMRHEINNLMTSKNPIVVYTAKQESYKWLEAVYHDHSTERKKKNVKELMIFPNEEKTNTNKSKDKLNDFKFMDLKNEAEWGVVEDTFFLQYVTGKEPRAFMIHDKKFAETFRQVFDQLWKGTK